MLADGRSLLNMVFVSPSRFCLSRLCLITVHLSACKLCRRTQPPSTTGSHRKQPSGVISNHAILSVMCDKRPAVQRACNMHFIESRAGMCLLRISTALQVRALQDDLEQLEVARPGTSGMSSDLRRQVQALQVRSAGAGRAGVSIYIYIYVYVLSRARGGADGRLRPTPSAGHLAVFRLRHLVRRSGVRLDVSIHQGCSWSKCRLACTVWARCTEVLYRRSKQHMQTPSPQPTGSLPPRILVGGK